MRVVSLLAHEHPTSAIATIENIATSTQPDLIVLHWNGKSIEERDGLSRGIELGKFQCEVMLNPTSANTSFGNILKAHVLNSEFARASGATKDSQFMMHASNDFYLRPSYEYLNGHQHLFQVRKLVKNSIQRCAELPIVTELTRRFGNCIYSQPEGTSYPLELFTDAKKILADDADIFVDMAAEEILIPTLAVSAGVEPTSTPTIFSEVIRSEIYGIRFWNVFNNLGLLQSSAKRLWVRRLAEELSIVNMSISPVLGPMFSRDRESVQRIRCREIQAIFTGSFGRRFEDIHEVEETWHAYMEGALFGIKRIPRNPVDPRRIMLLRYVEELVSSEVRILNS